MMISVQTRSRLWNPAYWHSLWQDPAKVAWWTTYGMFHVFVVLLVVRRLLGAFENALSASGILAVTSLVVLLSIALKVRMQIAGVATKPEPSAILILGSLTAALAILLLAISMPGTPILGLVASWVILTGAETSWWTNFLVRATTNAGGATVIRNQTSLQALESENSSERLDETWPAGVTQQMTRLRNDSGETAVGGVRVDFAAGERQRTVHLAFCPPFDGPPEFEIEQSEGSEVRVDVTQCEPFGVRLEVKLEQSSEQPQSVVLQFSAIQSS